MALSITIRYTGLLSFFRLTTSDLPLPTYLLPAPCSLLPAP
ncbi:MULTISPECIES: hypothetical protein [unclassified Moorena]|nr:MULTISPECIES: hypothetical protein [unclassified Moorena]